MANTIEEYLVGLGFDIDEQGAAQFNGILNGLSQVVKDLGTILMEAAEHIRTFAGSLGDQTGETEAAKEGLDEAAGAAEEFANQTTGASESAEKFGEEAEKMGESAGQAAKKVREANTEVQRTKPAAEQSAAATQKAAKGMNALAGAARVVKAALVAFVTKGVAQLVKSLYQQDAQLDKSAKALRKTREEARAHNTALAAMGVTYKEIQSDKALKSTYDDLTKLALGLQLPDAEKGVSIVHELQTAFLQLKVVGSYALQWLYRSVQTVAAGPLNYFRDLMSKITTGFKDNVPKWSEGFAHVIDWVLRIAAVVTRVVSNVIRWIGRIPGPVKAITAALLVLWGVIKAGPMGWVWLAISGILLLLDDFFTYMEGGQSLFGGFWGKLIEWINMCKPYIAKVGQWLEAAFTAGKNAVQWVIDQIKSFWQLLEENGTIQAFKETCTTTFELISGAIQGVIDWIKNLFSSANESSGFMATWENVKSIFASIIGVIERVRSFIVKLTKKIASMDAVQATLQTIADFVKNVFLAAWDQLSGVISAIASFIKGDFSGAWEALKTTAQTVAEDIGAAIDGLWKSISSVFSGIGEWFSGVFSGARDGIRNVFSSIGSFFSIIVARIKAPFVAIGNWFSEKFQAVVNFIKDPFGSIMSFFSGKKKEATEGFDGVDTDIGERFTNAYSFIEGAFSGLGGWVESTFGGLAGKISEKAGDVSEWASQGWRKITGFFSNAASNITGWFSGIKLPSAESISGFAEQAWGSITGFFGKAASDISGWFQGISLPSAEDISSFATTAWGTIKSTFEGAVGNISGWFSGLGTSVENMASGVADWASTAWTNISTALHESDAVDKISGWFSGIGEKVGQQVSNASQWATDTWNNIQENLGGVKGWFDETFQGVGATVESAISAVGTVATNAWNGIKDAASGVGDWFKGLFGWTDEAETSTEELSDASQEQRAAILAAFEGADTDVAAIFTSMATLSAASIEILSVSMGALKEGIVTKFNALPADFKSIFSAAANGIRSAFTPVSTWFVSQVNRMKAALNSMPRSITISVSTTGTKFSLGGRVDRETKATVGEDGREYIIPITKPGRALPLIKAAAADLGLTLENAQSVAKSFGGGAMSNAMPQYARPEVRNTTNTTQVDARQTFNIHGNDGKSIAAAVGIRQNQFVRNLKGVFA